MDASSVFLGNRHSKFFDFEINSLKRIIDLSINPSFARTVGFQIHQMFDNSYRIFWNFGMKIGEKFAEIVQYAKETDEYKNKMKAPVTEVLTEICSDARFAERIKSKIVIHSADLSENDMKLVNAVIDANWAPVEYGGGLDGQSYKIKIYGKNPREYNRWCDIPADWTDLIPLVDFLIDVANLTPRHCYEVT